MPNYKQERALSMINELALPQDSDYESNELPFRSFFARTNSDGCIRIQKFDDGDIGIKVIETPTINGDNDMGHHLNNIAAEVFSAVEDAYLKLDDLKDYEKIYAIASQL